MKLKLFFVMGLMALLSGCTMIDLADPEDFPLESVRFKGSFSWHDENHNLTQYTFLWKQYADAVKITIPISGGFTHLQIYADSSSASLRGLYNQSFNSLEDLFSTYFGWSLPYPQIRYWMLGQTSPHDNTTKSSSKNGNLDQILYEDITVTLSRYDEQFDPPRPRKILLEKKGKQLIVEINEWL